MNLDELLNCPNGTFHDSTIERIEIDYLARTAKLQVQVSTGDPDATDPELRESKKLGRLLISGLLFLVIDPPDESYPYQTANGLWVSEREFTPGELPGTSALPKNLPPNTFAHLFFVQEWNSCIYLAASHAEFEWL